MYTEEMNAFFEQFSVAELRLLGNLRDRCRDVLSENARPNALEALHQYAHDAILAGGLSPLFDEAMKVSVTDVSSLEMRLNEILDGHIEWMTSQITPEQRKQMEEIVRAAESCRRSSDFFELPPIDVPMDGINRESDGIEGDIPNWDLGKAGTIAAIAAFAKDKFKKHKPSTRAIQLWIDSGALRVRERVGIWEFSISDLKVLVTGEVATPPDQITE